MLQKVIRDGYVAVLISPGFGAGWYTWHDIEELLFDPIVVEMVESGKHFSLIQEYCENAYRDRDGYYYGASDLIVEWVREGTEFIVTEYDGNESIMFKEDLGWITA